MSHTDDAPWQLTLDAVAHYPRPGTNVPGNFAFSPDARLLTYLFSERGDLIRSLWALDTTTGERRIIVGPPGEGTTDANVNPDEALRRERQRLREGGITHYSWAKAADRILVPINGQLYITSSQGGGLQAVAPDDDPAVDARITPTGRQVVFVRRRELWVADVDEGEARQLTFDASPTGSNGLAEYIAQEEMGRAAGFWVSPDTKLVAFTEVEEGHIPVYPIVHQSAQWRVEEHRYPFAGGANARVRLGIVPLDGGTVRWLDLSDAPDFYLARIDWTPGGKLAVQIESRDQRQLDLLVLDVDTGERTELLRETLDPWINLHNDLRFLADGRFIWSSERSGFRHLYLHGPDGPLIRPLTSGDWAVDQIVQVDEPGGAAYFSAGRDDPRERHLFRVGLNGGEATQITREPGIHGATFAPDGSRYIETFESRSTPPTQVVRFVATPMRTVPLPPPPPRATPAPSPSQEEGWGGGSPDALAGQGAASVLDAEAHPLAVCTPLAPSRVAPGLTAPELVELAASDGTPLYGALYRPTDGPGPFPLIVGVYGGPHAQTVTESWGMTVDLRAQYLTTLGFAIFKLDNRGSARRGLAFEAALHRRMGTIELQDQVDGVRWLVEQGIADPSHVGIYGWSYGGYMTLMALLTAPDIFHVGIAGAPVADWDGYDTHYTERYMGTPTENPDGYRAGSALTHAANLRGKLLIVHGMVDENVHFRHTARLITALQAANRPFDLLAFPSERHMPRDAQGRRYLEQRMADYFVEHLLPSAKAQDPER